MQFDIVWLFTRCGQAQWPEAHENLRPAIACEGTPERLEMKTTVDTIFTTLLEEQYGYSFGTPKRASEKSLAVVLPILRVTEHTRAYVTLPEAEKAQVFDTGKIDEMEVNNGQDTPVFIRTGSLFRGATQERTAQRSFVVYAGRKTKIAVRCVHASKGIHGATKVSSTDFIPLDALNKNYHKGYVPKDQSAYWKNVGHTTNCMRRMASSGNEPHITASAHSHPMWSSAAPVFGGCDMAATPDASAHSYFMAKEDNLAHHYDAFAKNFEAILAGVKRQENQTGMAFLTDTGVQLIEIFDHPDSWKALHESAVKALGTKAVTEDIESVFEFKPKHAHTLVRKTLALPWERSRIYYHEGTKNTPEVTITGLTAKDYVGECVEIDDQVAHLMVFKRED